MAVLIIIRLESVWMDVPFFAGGVFELGKRRGGWLYLSVVLCEVGDIHDGVFRETENGDDICHHLCLTIVK